MKKEFKTEITSVLIYSFEISEDGIYVITIRASCKPGWRNRWWLTLKGFLENILDLHLDDQDLRIEIDDQVFRKPKGKKGLFNSPAAFSGTKTLGKTKTVVFFLQLARGPHSITFIPDGSPYLESVDVTKSDNPQKIISYLNTKAEDEHYYSWYTFTLVDLPLTFVSITVQAGINEGKDDDDVKIVINDNLQENPNSRHKKSYFCGFTLKGKENSFTKTLHLLRDTHHIELFTDRTPTLKSITLLLTEEKELRLSDTSKREDVLNSHYVIKDTAFIDDDSMTEEEIEGFLKEYGENYPNHLYHRIFEGKKSSFWIKKITTEFEINPRIILTKLQIEGLLIIGKDAINPLQEQFDWALGAGKTDTGTFPQYKGFLTQLKAGTRIFKEVVQELKEPPFVHKNVDGKPLTVLNRATYALYRYTPHIAGADLFYRVYAQFFGKEDLGGKI